MTYFALDIETDTNAEPVDPEIPAALDPRAAQITAITLLSEEGYCWHQQARNPMQERMMLEDFSAFVHDNLDGDDTLVTWNGGAFDIPYLMTRTERLRPGLRLNIWRMDRKPKYSPLPGWAGVMGLHRNLTNGDWHPDHLDLAYVYKHDSEINGRKWSLKPTAQHFGAGDGALLAEDLRGAESSSFAPHQMARYNVHDCVLVLDLLGHALAEFGQGYVYSFLDSLHFMASDG